jgi:hypothetical protein
LIELYDRFAREQASMLNELINANECGLALEIMTEILAKADAAIPKDQIDEIARLAEQMELPTVLKLVSAMKVQ